jgi:hypothetical protein
MWSLESASTFSQSRWSLILGCPSGNIVSTATTLNYHFISTNREAKMYRHDCITSPIGTAVMLRVGIRGGYRKYSGLVRPSLKQLW